MSLAEQVGQLLVKARGKQSRRSLALEGDVSDVSLLALEEGTANPTLKRLEKVGALYGGVFEIRFRRTKGR